MSCDSRGSLITHPDAISFLEFCKKEFFNSHAWFHYLEFPSFRLREMLAINDPGLVSTTGFLFSIRVPNRSAVRCR